MTIRNFGPGYIGLSTDTKPVLHQRDTGVHFIEEDTGIVYTWFYDRWGNTGTHQLIGPIEVTPDSPNIYTTGFKIGSIRAGGMNVSIWGIVEETFDDSSELAAFANDATLNVKFLQNGLVNDSMYALTADNPIMGVISDGIMFAREDTDIVVILKGGSDNDTQGRIQVYVFNIY